ncbi:hypothetical protein D3C72_1415490 [compost metagenome]
MGLQGLFERLEAVAVFDLDHIPVFFQQLFETMAQARCQAIDAGAHGITDIHRCQQVQWAVQGASG